MTMLLFLIILLLQVEVDANQRIKPAMYWVQFLQQFALDTFPHLFPCYLFPSPDSNPISADIA